MALGFEPERAYSSSTCLANRASARQHFAGITLVVYVDWSKEPSIREGNC